MRTSTTTGNPDCRHADLRHIPAWPHRRRPFPAAPLADANRHLPAAEHQTPGQRGSLRNGTDGAAGRFKPPPPSKALIRFAGTGAIMLIPSIMTSFDVVAAGAAARYRIAATVLTVRRNSLAREQARNPQDQLASKIAEELVDEAEQELQSATDQATELRIGDVTAAASTEPAFTD